MNSKALAAGQGLFYVASGLWPVFDIKSFEKVTGPKEDKWLVKTVGGLIAAAGVSMIFGAIRTRNDDEVSQETKLLGAGHAFVLGTVSGFYSSIGRISKIYLLDSITEYGLVGAWIMARPQPKNAVIRSSFQRAS